LEIARGSWLFENSRESWDLENLRGEERGLELENRKRERGERKFGPKNNFGNRTGHET